MSLRVFNVDDIEASWVTLSVGDDTYTTQIVATCNHAEVTCFKFDELQNFSASDIQANCVVDFDQWVRISDSATVMCNQVRNTLSSSSDTLDTAQLVSCLSCCDTVQDESALYIIEDAEVFIGTLDSNNI